MSALSKSGRMLRWGMLPLAAALVLALGASPADANHKHKKWYGNNGWGGHSQHWGNGGWGWNDNWRPRHHRHRHNYYSNYYYYSPPPAYYYPPPVYYYPQPRYYSPYGGSFSFGLTVPFD